MPGHFKKKRSSSHGFDNQEDLNYVDYGSELSSGDEVLNTSEAGSPDTMHTRKRGRPKLPIKEDDAQSDIDESGELKVDEYGHLLEGREYRVPTFKLPTRGDTLFMFSKDPAALLGFRDSFVFLKKNTKLVKVHIDNTEKGYLVDSHLLRSTFRTREISVVTARSVFKQFGHRVVRGGKKGRDDYYFTEDVDNGEEDLSEEEQIIKEPPQLTTSTPAAVEVPIKTEMGRNSLLHKSTSYDVSSQHLDRIYKAAISTRQFNTSIFTYRTANPTNYDLLSNVYQIPKDKQAFIDTSFKGETTLENLIPNQSNLDFLNDTNFSIK